jgi:hypothetical protein
MVHLERPPPQASQFIPSGDLIMLLPAHIDHSILRRPDSLIYLHHEADAGDRAPFC